MARQTRIQTNSIEENNTPSTNPQFLPPIIAPPAAPPPPREVKIGPAIVLSLMSFDFILLAISVGVPWFRKEQYATGANGEDVLELFGLWKSTRREGDIRTITTKTSEIACTQRRHRIQALEPLSIISLAISFITVIFSILNFCYSDKNSRIRVATICCVAATFIFLTIECSISINVYTWDFKKCLDEPSYYARAFEPYVGFAFTLVSWVLSAVAGVLVYNEPVFFADARSIYYGSNIFTFFAFLAFLFTILGISTPQWFYKDDTNKTITHVLLWKERRSILWSINSETNITNVQDLGCSEITNYFRAVESFSIISVIFNAAAFFTGYFVCKGLDGSLRIALTLGYIGSVTTIIEWALALRIYYGSWCNGIIEYHRRKYILSSGFALTVSGFTLITIGTVILTVAELIRHRHFPATAPKRTMKDIFVEIVN